MVTMILAVGIVSYNDMLCYDALMLDWCLAHFLH